MREYKPSNPDSTKIVTWYVRLCHSRQYVRLTITKRTTFLEATLIILMARQFTPLNIEFASLYLRSNSRLRGHNYSQESCLRSLASVTGRSGSRCTYRAAVLNLWEQRASLNRSWLPVRSATTPNTIVDTPSHTAFHFYCTSISVCSNTWLYLSV